MPSSQVGDGVEVDEVAVGVVHRVASQTLRRLTILLDKDAYTDVGSTGTDTNIKELVNVLMLSVVLIVVVVVVDAAEHPSIGPQCV